MRPGARPVAPVCSGAEVKPWAQGEEPQVEPRPGVDSSGVDSSPVASSESGACSATRPLEGLAGPRPRAARPG